MAALWIAADLAGAVELPDAESRRQAVVEQLAFMDVAVDRHHCRGTKIIPFSMKNVDEVLGDLDLQISTVARGLALAQPDLPRGLRQAHAAAARAAGGPAAAGHRHHTAHPYDRVQEDRMTETTTTEPSHRPTATASSGSDEGDNVGAIGLGIHVRLTGEDTKGAYSLFEYVVPAGLGGPPTHIHTREDELFTCTQGKVRVELDGEEHILARATRC